MGYIKQLDSIRALAILAVICSHWFSLHRGIFKIAEGIGGPDIFFTISGFLITKILLGECLKAEQEGGSKGKVFGLFFIRRALRIFRAYYFTIFLVYFLNPTGESLGMKYMVSFTQNILFYKNQHWGPLGHLWSMGVEEQFYLFWP